MIGKIASGEWSARRRRNSPSAISGAKILFVVPRLHTNLFFAIRALVENGSRVEVFVDYSSQLEDHELVKPVIFGSDPKVDDLHAALRKFCPELIFLRQVGKLSMHVGRWAKTHRVRTLFYNQKPVTARRPLWKIAHLALTNQPVERITPCRGLEWHARNDWLASYLPWPVGQYDRSKPAPSPREFRRPLRILCVGKLSFPRKNQQLLAQAIQDYRLQDSVRLTLVGSAPQSAIPDNQQHYTFLKSLSDSEWVSLLESQPFKNMEALYRDHDVCVLPSHREPLGTSPVEGMAYATVPVISTECGSAGYIRHGMDGLLVDMNAPESLGRTLQRLVQDPDLVPNLSANALATANSELSEQRFLERISRLLQGHRVPPDDGRVAAH